MYAREKKACRELAKTYSSTAVLDICDILIDRKKLNKALNDLDLFEKDRIELIEPNVHHENFDWVGFIYSDKFDPDLHIKHHFSQERIPAFAQTVLASVSKTDKPLLSAALNHHCEGLLIYAACQTVNKNNKLKQNDFYDEINLLAADMKHEGRMEEFKLLSELGKSHRVIEHGALKDKSIPLALLLQRISRQESAKISHDSYLNTEQLRSIMQKLLTAISDVKTESAKLRKSPFFAKLAFSNEKLSARSKEIFTLTSLLQADTREDVVKVIEESRKIESPTPRKTRT